MRFSLYRPYKLQVRLAIWLGWAALVLGVMAVGSRSPEPNHPGGLVLLGLGLVGSGALAALALASRAAWQGLIDPEVDAPQARKWLAWTAGLGLLAGAALIWTGLGRLL